ncbi:MAG TPA: alpha/beta hydrolase [Solirubrobacteraceae bacterium]
MSKARLIWCLLFVRGRTHRYGEHRSQCAELHLPHRAGRHPVVVLIHGGSWRARYGKRVMRALAHDLRKRGYAVWNVEYRRVGEGGGWPQTLEDVALAIDTLPTLDAPLDLSRTLLLGHSAGGQLALWAASRADDGLQGVVSMAGVCDLAGGYREWRGGAVLGLMGASPEQAPERYADADPMAHLPLAIPTLLVHGREDETVSVRLSRSYAEAARAAGGEVELVEIDGPAGRHRAHIYPEGPGWEAVLAWLGVRRRGAQAPAASERASATSSRTP